MKKLTALFLAAMLCFGLMACTQGEGNGGDASPNPDEGGSKEIVLTDLMAEITEGLDLPAAQDIEITDETFSAYLFIDPIEGAEVLVQEAAINAIAHSVALIKVPNGADVSATADAIEANANPGKWICVQAEKTVVKHSGNVILFVMSDAATADAISANFDAAMA